MSSKPSVAPGDRLELLETFIRIAETGGIGSAARSLETTQPTVTRRLQQLEGLLDAKLVERSTQGLSLTPIGATLLPEAREMTERWRGLEHVVDARNAELAGTVRVLSAGEIGERLLPPIFAEFLRRYPDVRLEARFRDGSADLVGDGADFALTEGRISAEGSVTREISRTRTMLCAAPDIAQKLAESRGVAIARCEPLALEGAPLIAAGSPYGQTIRFFGRSGETEDVPFDRVAAIESTDAALILALEGCGLAILPDWRIDPFVAAGRLTRIAVDWTTGETPICLTWSPSRLRAASASALLEMVRVELPALLGGAEPIAA